MPSSPAWDRSERRYTRALNHESIEVRPCREEDLDAVLRIWADSRSGHASTEDRREDLQRLLADSPGSLLVARAGDEPIGAVIAGWDGWRGNIYRLAVLDAHRRRGTGTILVRAAEAALRERGCRRITALVAFDDEAAGSFWDTAGYPVDGEIGRRVRNV